MRLLGARALRVVGCGTVRRSVTVELQQSPGEFYDSHMTRRLMGASTPKPRLWYGCGGSKYNETASMYWLLRAATF